MAQESGRSRIEMLSVLAVIGVLSVTAIASDNKDLAKLRAKEILNATSVRAMSISAKLQRDQTLSTIPTDFSDSSVAGTTFVESATSSGNNFTLTINNMNEDVCGQITKMVDDQSNVKISDDCSTFTYMHDLSAPVTIAYNDNAGAKTCSSASDCDAGCQTCTGGKCISICELGQYCGRASLHTYGCISLITGCDDNNDCRPGCCSANGICVKQGTSCTVGSFYNYGPYNEGCYENFPEGYNPACDTSKRGCTNNSQCKTNEYCALDGNNSGNINTGECKALGAINIVTGKTGSAAIYNGFRYSNDSMSWWSADNWCKAQGKHMVSMDEVGFTGGYSSGYCNVSNCTGIDWNALRNAIKGSGNYWTSSSYDASCAFFVVPAGESVVNNERFYEESALCK